MIIFLKEYTYKEKIIFWSVIFGTIVALAIGLGVGLPLSTQEQTQELNSPYRYSSQCIPTNNFFLPVVNCVHRITGEIVEPAKCSSLPMPEPTLCNNQPNWFCRASNVDSWEVCVDNAEAPFQPPLCNEYVKELTRQVQCQVNGQEVLDISCTGTGLSKPVEFKSCVNRRYTCMNNQKCELNENGEFSTLTQCLQTCGQFKWKTGDYDTCSSNCGVQSRSVECVKVSDSTEVVNSESCSSLPKPPSQQNCSLNDTVCNWQVTGSSSPFCIYSPFSNNPLTGQTESYANCLKCSIEGFQTGVMNC